LKLAEESNMAEDGLFASLKNLSATLIAIAYNRIELFSLDLEEKRQELMSLLVMTLISLFCFFIGMVLLAIFILIVFWDTHRLLALGMLTAVFLTAGTALSVIAMRKLTVMPRVFKTSLAELSKDHQLLDGTE
jgi:uncharacterized membrane protein YqjE